MPYRKGPAGTAERLHSQVVRARGNCERCGSSGPLECAHIIRRRFVATRTDETNAWALCRECHRKVDENAVEFALLVNETIGRTSYDLLWDRAHLNTKVWRESDWKAETVRLRALLKERVA